MSEGLHSGVHPDPDLLNAFVESALTEHERVECMAHLAECTQCREVVFLAEKAAQIADPIVVAPTPVSVWRRFFRPLAVGFVIATAMSAVFSFGLYRMIRSAEPQPRLTVSTNSPVVTLPAANDEEQTPKLQLTPRKVSPRLVPKERDQPPASRAPTPSTAAPTEIDSPSPPGPPPAPVAAAAPVAEVAALTGTVIDPAGAVIASARVELKSADTGATYTSMSDARGQYSLAGLAPGRYDFSVTVLGFKKFVRSNIKLQAQETAKLDSILNVGAAAEAVTVTAEATLLKTESGELSHQADSTSISELPSLTRVPHNSPAVTLSPLYPLPNQLTPVSVATKDKLVVAVDSAGALFVNKKAGKTWTRVKATWKGKAVRVGVNANAMFELTTDSASTWVSIDGQRWSAAHISR